MKAAIYCRVSTEEQELETQERLCREYCERSGWQIVKIYCDVGTGKDDKRPSYWAMLDDMRHFRFNAIVVAKLDRMGRSLQNLLAVFQEMRLKGVHFVSVTQQIDTTGPVGQLQLQIMGAFAEYERNLISERTKESLRGKEGVGKRGPDKKPRKKRGVLRSPLSSLGPVRSG